MGRLRQTNIFMNAQTNTHAFALTDAPIHMQINISKEPHTQAHAHRSIKRKKN